MNIIIFILAMLFSITIHELGHYATSKAFGIKVEKLCVGFGIKIFAFQKWGTEFEFRLLPLGGYIESDDNELDKISILKEWIIDLSGVFMNFIFTIIGLFIFFENNIFITTKIFFSKIIRPCLDMMLEINNYQQPVENILRFISQNTSVNGFWLIFAFVNLSLLLFNLLPIPLLDGGQLIMCVIRRISNKFENLKKHINKITNVVYLICWIVLFLPIIIEVINWTNNLLVNICSIIMGMLMYILIRVISKTEAFQDMKKDIR